MNFIPTHWGKLFICETFSTKMKIDVMIKWRESYIIVMIIFINFLMMICFHNWHPSVWHHSIYLKYLQIFNVQICDAHLFFLNLHSFDWVIKIIWNCIYFVYFCAKCHAQPILYNETRHCIMLRVSVSPRVSFSHLTSFCLEYFFTFFSFCSHLPPTLPPRNIKKSNWFLMGSNM